MRLSLKGRDKPNEEEQKTIRLVNAVRELRDESAFIELQRCLEFYVRLFGNMYKIPGCDSDEIEAECWYALRYKAIEDFNPARGKFLSFAILCIRRHLFSIIKGNNQQKRRALNESLSLDENRGEDGDLSLINLVVKSGKPADEELSDAESRQNKRDRLLRRLSKLEREVCKLYLSQYHYDEIVDSLEEVFPDRNITKKTVDNALQRARSKAHKLAKKLDFSE